MLSIMITSSLHFLICLPSKKSQYANSHPSDMDLTKENFIKHFKENYSEIDLDSLYDRKKEYLEERKLYQQAQSLVEDLEKNPRSGEIYQSLMFILEKLDEDYFLFRLLHERKKWKSFLQKLKDRILTEIRYYIRFIYQEPFIW